MSKTGKKDEGIDRLKAFLDSVPARMTMKEWETQNSRAEKELAGDDELIELAHEALALYRPKE